MSSNEELKQLQAKWYAKLKKSGFEDIEQEDGNLKVWSNNMFLQAPNPELWKEKEKYYQLAGQFLYEHKFKNKQERKIWELHAQAVSIRNIVKALKKARRPVYRDLVHKVLQRLRNEMSCSKKTPS